MTISFSADGVPTVEADGAKSAIVAIATALGGVIALGMLVFLGYKYFKRIGSKA